jgi:hypothetical protein
MRRRQFIAAAATLPLVASAHAESTPVDPMAMRRDWWAKMTDREKFMYAFGRPDPSADIVPSPYFDVKI